jgi:hypothetical protein
LQAASHHDEWTLTDAIQEPTRYGSDAGMNNVAVYVSKRSPAWSEGRIAE